MCYLVSFASFARGAATATLPTPTLWASRAVIQEQRKFASRVRFCLRQMDICEGVFFFRFSGHTHSTEHPKDPKGKYPAIWATPQWKYREAQGDIMIETDQCMFGAETRKGTGIGGNLPFIRRLRRRCGHRFHAGRSRGQVQGVFLSKAIATYPSELCRVLAGLHINAYAERIRFASDLFWPFRCARI